MRPESRCNFRIFAVATSGLVLGVCSFGPSAFAGQPPAPTMQRPVVAVPDVVEPPPTASGEAATNLEMVSSNAEHACSRALAKIDCRTAPACCDDQVNKVPNFLGDFVARPSQALVNVPSIAIEQTTTLTFVGLTPSDVAGGRGSNTFYAPFQPNGIVGPGGPYTVFTDVTGNSNDGNVSILDQNLLLTALVTAEFPGAVFVSGVGLLDPPFSVAFDYLLTTVATTPGLVALVNLPNPSGGGLVGRNKYFDNGSPAPRDRVFFDYQHISDFGGSATRFDINRYVIGVEKTFNDGLGSLELRVPFAGTANSDQVGGQGTDVSHTEFGNTGLLLKVALFRNANWIVTAGLGLSMPTADDSRLQFNGRTLLEIQNDAWLLQPIVGAIWAPNDRFYAQAGLQFDIDANGNPVYALSPGGEFSRRGVLTDQAYLYASGAVGYWLYQGGTGRISAVSLQGELHYNRTINDQDVVFSGSLAVADFGSDVDVLNATTGVNFVLGERATLTTGVSFPVGGDSLYDWNLMARLNVPFGSGAR